MNPHCLKIPLHSPAVLAHVTHNTNTTHLLMKKSSETFTQRMEAFPSFQCSPLRIDRPVGRCHCTVEFSNGKTGDETSEATSSNNF